MPISASGIGWMCLVSCMIVIHTIASLPPEDPSLFSGVYKPNIKYTAEDFVGAAMFKKDRLYARPHASDESLNKLVRLKCKGCTTFMTRDFLDFLVENPTSAINLIPRVGVDMRALIGDLVQRLVANTKKLKHVEYQSNASDPRIDRTVGVLLYESQKYGMVAPEIKKVFLEAAFWSIYRHFKNVVIMVKTSTDRKSVKSLHLPVLNIYTLDSENAFVSSHSQHHDKSLQWKSLLDIYARWESDPAWKRFDYMYYSLADIVSHFRHTSSLLDVLDSCDEGTFVLVPHRFVNIPIKQSFPKEFHHLWREPRTSQQNIPDIKVYQQSLRRNNVGQCCDNGRFHFSQCNTWWYHCPKWGLANYTAWVKFGDHGLYSPAGTVHQATCKYSNEANPAPCPLKDGCDVRVPQRIGEPGSGKYDFCEEYHKVRLHGMKRGDHTDPVVAAEMLNVRHIRRRSYSDAHLKQEHFAYCGQYDTTMTYHAMTNFGTCDMWVCPGTKLSMSMCSSEGDCWGNTVLRLYDSFNHTVQYAGNDDHCDSCSEITYHFTKPCQWYTLREGCWGASRCGGRVIVKEYREDSRNNTADSSLALGSLVG